MSIQTIDMWSGCNVPFQLYEMLNILSWNIEGFHCGDVYRWQSYYHVFVDEKAAQARYSRHLGFGVGGLIPTQMTRPFLTPVVRNGDATGNVTSSDNATADIADVSTTVIPANISDDMQLSWLVYPYSIASAFAAIVAIALIVLHIKGPPTSFPKRLPQNKFCELLLPGSCAYGQTVWHKYSAPCVSLLSLCCWRWEGLWWLHFLISCRCRRILFKRQSLSPIDCVLHILPRWTFPWYFHQLCRADPLAHIWGYHLRFSDNISGSIFSIQQWNCTLDHHWVCRGFHQSHQTHRGKGKLAAILLPFSNCTQISVLGLNVT